MFSDDMKVLPLNPRPLVLVVDDEAHPRSITTRMVRALGYQARSCHGGRAALSFLKAHDYLRGPHRPSGELLFPSLATGKEAILIDSRKVLDHIAIRAGFWEYVVTPKGDQVKDHAGQPKGAGRYGPRHSATPTVPHGCRRSTVERRSRFTP
jgi:hypothetical protein